MRAWRPLPPPCRLLRAKSYVLKFVRGHLPADLKDLPGTLGCLYGSLPDVDEYAQFVLPPACVQSYHQLGYVTLPRAVLDAAQVDILADEADELANNVEHHPRSTMLYATSLADLTDKPLFTCQGQWRAAWGMHDLVYHPTLTVAACQLLHHSPVRLWYDEVWAKAARVGPCVPWQQHYARWQHTAPDHHVSVLLALDGLSRDRGAPCLIPGSHRWRQGAELLPSVPLDPTRSEAEQLNTIWEVSNEEEKEVLLDSPPVTLELRRGEAVMIHPRTVYATHANRSLSRVRSCVVHYMGDGVRTVRQGPLLPHTHALPANSLIYGPYYPVVFDPAVAENVPMLNEGQDRLG